jgi:RNA polymerase sigma factor (sigma-70 family)
VGIFKGLMMRVREKRLKRAWKFVDREMEQMEREWRRCFVLWSMRQLSERERQVIRRLYWDEWTETEIAQEMEISQPMISKIKQQALRKLKDLLSGLL